MLLVAQARDLEGSLDTSFTPHIVFSYLQLQYVWPLLAFITAPWPRAGPLHLLPGLLQESSTDSPILFLLPFDLTQQPEQAL